MLWLGVSELPEKSWITVSGGWSVWLGCPDTSATVRLILYVPGVARFGRLGAIVSVTGAFALIGAGLAGVTAHSVPDIALASRLASIDPL